MPFRVVLGWLLPVLPNEILRLSGHAVDRPSQKVRPHLHPPRVPPRHHASRYMART